MIKLCRVEEVRAADEAAMAAGRTEDDLMTAAGRGVVEAIDDSLFGGGHEPTVVLVGPGNNGGDGLVIAATLIERGERCLIWSFQRDGLAGAPVPAAVAERFEWIDGHEELARACAEAGLIVDAVFGVGGRADLPEPVAAAFDLAWQARVDHGTVLWAVDVPSGVDADTGAAHERAFRADHTAMIGLPKIGLFKAPALRHAGELHLVDIGLDAPEPEPGVPQLVTEVDVRRWLPRRQRDTHKRAVGALMIVGGAPTYFGAPRLSAGAAMRVGAGLVTLAVARSLVGSIAAALPEVTFLPLPEGELGGVGTRMAGLVQEHADDYQALLVGPGLGQDPPVDEFLGALFGVRGSSGSIGFGSAQPRTPNEAFKGRAVIDADGLNWLARHPEWVERLTGADLILTPHPGELSRLLDVTTDAIVADPWGHALEAARRFEQVVVLKHAHSVVAAPDGQLIVGPQALPSLATAGTGDVLAGTIAGLMAQGMPSLEAAAAGIYIGAQAAMVAEYSGGTLGLVATDVLDELPSTVRYLYDATW